MKEKFLHKITSCIALIFIGSLCTPLFAQSNKFNLEKYWRYRERLKKDFIVVTSSNTSGTNIPALELTLEGGVKSKLSWGDANANMSHYIGMLATEYRLLKNSNGDYRETLKELYYAFRAIDRLDETSEGKFPEGQYTVGDPLNGWFIRDDVDPQFWNTYHSQLGFSSSDVTKFQSHSNQAMVDEPKHYLESISQDNVYHLLEALGLVHALVDEYLPSPRSGSRSFRPDDTYAAWAQDITELLVGMMHHEPRIYMLCENWQNIAWFKNLDLEEQEDLEAEFGPRYFDCELEKPPIFAPPEFQLRYKTHCDDLSSKWYIRNPRDGKLAYEGSGSDWDTWLYYCYGLAHVGNKITGKDFMFEPANKSLQEDLFLSILDGEITISDNDLIKDLIRDLFLTPGATIPDILAYSVDNNPPDPYKVKTLATVAGIGGEDTFWDLRRDEVYTGYGPYGTSRYVHFPLMFAAINGAPSNYNGSSEFNSDRILYENLLSQAPCQGPRSYHLFAGDDYSYQWSTPSRLVWPENIEQDASSTIEYNGLDYMLLHNLYCLVYGQDFRKLTIVEEANFPAGQIRTESAVDIIGKNIIFPNANITYSAQSSVKLVPGFHAQAGSTFKANIVASNVNYVGYSQFNTCTNIPSGGRIATFEGKTKSIMTNTSASNKLSTTTATTEEQETKLLTYPNPVTESFFVMLSSRESIDNAEITVIELTGATVRRQPFTNSSADVIDMNGMPRGIYIVRISSGRKSYNGKVFVK